jgi:dolichol-phosphate mannosyltransferase
VIHILLPAYNEADAISDLLKEIDLAAPTFGEPCRVVLVDDGSTDRTAERARRCTCSVPVTLLRHDRNRGLGAALATGIAEIMDSGRPGDVVVTMDADLTHPPRFIADLRAAMKREVDVVIASRYAKGGKEIGVSLVRRVLSRGAARIYRMVLRQVRVSDFSCGYRMVRWEVLRRTWQTWGDGLFKAAGFSCTGELLLKILGHTQPDRLAEIPFILHYERKRGASKMPTWRTIRGTLRLLLAARRLRQPPTPH